MFFFGGGKCPNLGVVNVRILGVVNVLLANDSQSFDALARFFQEQPTFHSFAFALIDILISFLKALVNKTRAQEHSDKDRESGKAHS